MHAAITPGTADHPRCRAVGKVTLAKRWLTRWYAPALGRFISEDSLLGTPSDPPSRHLYAYGAGEPIGRWDPDGFFAVTTTAPAPWAGQVAGCILEGAFTGARVAIGVSVFVITLPFLVTGDTPLKQAIPLTKTRITRNRDFRRCVVIGEVQARVAAFP